MKKSLGLFIMGSAVSGFLVGCTHLEVRNYRGDDIASHSGYAYMLDYTQFDIVLKRTLVACNSASAPQIKIEATVISSLVPDGAHVYVIDPQSMISAFKISNISVDYKNGRLTGFNSSATDQTAEFIGAVAVTSGKIAMLAAGVPLPVSTASDFQYCSAEAVSRIKVLKDNKKPLEKIAADIEDANQTLATLTAQFAAKPTKKLQASIVATSTAIKQAKSTLETLTKDSTKAEEWLTDSKAIVWPESGLVFTKDGPSFPLPISTVGRWFDTQAIRSKLEEEYAPSVRRLDSIEVLRNDAEGDGNAARLGISAEQFSRRYPKLTSPFNVQKCPDSDSCTQLDRLTADLLQPHTHAIETEYRLKTTFAAVSLHLVQRGTYGSTKLRESAGSAKDGLRYRVPASGWLYICEYPQPCFEGGVESEPVAKVQGPIAQLGTVFNIPFSSPLFASGSIKVDFDEYGRLTHAGLVRENAAALEAAGAGDSVVSEVAALRQAKRNATLEDFKRQTELAAARKKLAEVEESLKENPADKLSEELRLLELQQKIGAARAALVPGRVKELSNELEIAKIEAQLVETRERYATDPQADLVALKEQYEAQTALLNARKVNLEAEVAVRNAESALDAVGGL